MPQTERFTQVLNLASLDVFIETEINDDSYFQISGLPETLGFGKHAFSITYKDPAGQPRLKENTTITFEFVDSNGVTVFSELADYEDVSGGATAYVWIKEDPLRTADSIADGPLSLYIVGTLDGVPEEFADRKNLRSTFKFEVRKNFPNLSPIVFYDVDSLLTGANFSESIELDQNDGVYTRSYLTVSSSHLQTQGGRVAFGELSYRETGSRADDFKVISQFPLEGTTAVFETDSDGEEGISPLSHLLKIPTPTEFRRDTPVYFKLKFLDENKTPAQYRDNNRLNTDIEITSSVINIEGSPFFIEKEDNLLKGSMFTGNAVGKGFEQSGKSSAFLKTVDYEGFLSASSGQGSPGVMFFSGSVLTSSGDEYTGVGLELHGGQNSSSFRFRSNPSLLEVKANTFFVGTEDTQFISGSGNNIEISSSGFHLTAEGDITASKFKMEGGVITGDVSILADLTANTIRTPAEIQGNPSTTFNASSSIDSSGFAIFKSASIGGFLVDETEIKSAQDDPFLRIKSNGQISGSALLLASNSFDVNFETLERFGGDNFQSFFMADSTGIRMQTSNFNLNAQRFLISSSDVGVMAVGSVPPTAFNTGSGFYVDGDSNLLIGKADGPRIQFDGFTTTISSSNFFLGSGQQFVSGSEGNIEISSSNFHLDNAGNVTMQGTITATDGAIGGFIVDSDEIKSSDGKIGLNSNTKTIHIDDSTFGNAGVQLQYRDATNLGRFHVGDGSSNFLKFDGTTLDIQTDAFFIGKDDTQFISGSVSSIEISSSLFHLNPRTNTLALSGSITATGGTIGGFIIEADRLVNTANTVELSTVTPGLNIKDALGIDRVTIKSGSFLEIGAGTQYIENRGFELTGSISAGRNLNPSILSWSYSMGGRATASLTDRAAFVDLHKAVSGDITLDVIVPSGTQNYTGHNNTYEIVQVITSSFTAGDTLSFAAVARFSSSFGEGKERALQPQYFRLEYSSSDSNGFKPFLPSANFTASNGYGQYFLGTGQYNSFGASAELPAAASFIKVILTGSINDDSGYEFEKPLFAKATMGNFKNDDELSSKTFTKSFVNTENPEFPETELTFDNFRLRSNTRKVEMTQEGLLIYNSEDSFFKMSADGIEIQGGSGVSAFGNSINREVLTNDSQVAGTLGAPALQPYTSDPEDVSTTAFQGNIGEFARGNHRHVLPFSTINSVVDGETFTNITASSIQVTNINPNKIDVSEITASNVKITGNLTGSATSVFDSGILTASKGLITTFNSPSATITDLNSTFGTFGGLVVEGDITAQRYIVSSSVTHMTTSFSSGSTVFGDSLDDNHVFTGSLIVSNSLTTVGRISGSELSVENHITASGNIDLGGRLFFESDEGSYIESHASDRVRIVAGGTQMLLLDQDNSRAVFGYQQKVFIGANNNAVPSNELEVDGTISGSTDFYIGTIGGSYVSASNGNIQISGNISGSVTSTGSFGNVRVAGLSQPDLFTLSQSIASRLTSEESEAEGSVISSSAQIATDISGSFVAPSASFSTRTTTLETTLVSEQTNIDNLQSDSASFSTRITTEEGNVDTLQSRNLTAGTGLTGGGDLTSDRTFAIDFSDSTFKSAVSGSFQGGGSNLISGSATSTGSFGSITTPGRMTVGAQLTVAEVSQFSSTMQFVGNQQIETSGGSDSLTIAPQANLNLGTTQTDHTFIGAASRNVTINATTTTINNTLAASAITATTLTTTGNISGSSTSTGSFGKLHLDDRITHTSDDLKLRGNLTLDGVNSPHIHIDGPVDAELYLDKGAANRQNSIHFKTAGTTKWIIGTPDSDNLGDGDEFYIGESGDTPTILINPDTSANILEFTANKISGSSTSTGSFGRIDMDGDIQGGNLFITSSGESVVQIGNNGETLNKFELHRNGTRKWVIYNDGRTNGFAGQDSLVFKHGIDSDGDDHINFYMKPDDQDVYFEGNVTGSSTSTGSFGALIVDSGTGGNKGRNLTVLDGTGVDGTNYAAVGVGTSDLYMSANSTYLTIGDKTNGGAGIFIQENTDAWNIFVNGGLSFNSGSDTVMKLHTDGDGVHEVGQIEFPMTNTLISGSVTSTGSFGKLQFANSHAHKGTLFVDNDIGYTTLKSLGDRSIDIISQRQIRFFTSADGSNYNQALNLASADGDATFFANVSSSATSTGSFGRIEASGVSDTLAAAIVAEIDNDEIPIAKLAEDAVTITAGNGLINGGSVTLGSSVTLNIGAGTGIDVAADAISVDVSDFMTNGSDNRIVTATGTDAMNAEANLTFDGSLLSVVGNISASGKITAEEFHTTFTSASIQFRSGSTKFGDTSDDIHSFTGSLRTTENVGIGTNTPDSLLHIHEGSAGTVTAHANGDELVIESNNSEVGMTFLGTTSSNQNILFGDPDDHKKGYIVYAHDGDSMTFGTAADNRVLINSSGLIGIGTTSPQVGLDIHTDTTETVAVFGQADDGNAYIATRVGEVQNRVGGYVFQVGSAAVAGYGSANTTATIVSTVKNDGGTLQGDLIFSTNGGDNLSQNMIILANGNIGIGVTDPDSPLEILNGGAQLKLSYDASNYSTLATDSAGDLVIASSGGDIKFSDDIQIADGESLGTTAFTSGFVGAGFRLDQGITETGKTSMTIDNITVRGTMSIFELMIQQVRATNGNLYITSTGKVESVTDNGSSNFTLNFDTGEGSGHGFAAGDVIRMQRFDNSGGGASVTISDLTVASVSSTGSISANLRSGTTPPSGGFEYVRLGNTSTGSRQGGIYLTADDSNAPFIDVFDNITSHADWNSNTGSANSNSGASGTKVRMGRLDGITSARFGALTNQYGLFASGSVFLEGTINAKKGNIGGWGIGDNAISSSGNTVNIDGNTQRITVSKANGTEMIHFGEVDGSSTYGLKIFDGTGTADNDILVELGEGGNTIAGWTISTGAITSPSDIITISSAAKRITINDGSVDRIYLGEVDGGTTYGLKIFDGTGTNDNDRLVELGAGDNMIVGWQLVPGRFQFDDPAGSIALDATNKQVSIYTGSINTAKPKVVMGNLPTSGDARYGFAVFSGSADADISDDDSYAVLITKDKARIAGWDLVPGRLKSGTVADINGNQASIALGTNATTATATPTQGLFFVSASTQPVFYVGDTFSYTNDVLKAGGWEVGLGQISSSTGTVRILSGDGGALALGSTPPTSYTSGTGAFISGSGQFLMGDAIGKRIQWDGSNIIMSASEFFLGNSSQFVSGSLGNIEISSSNFHLERTGDVTMQGTVTANAGEVSGFTITGSTLFSNETIPESDGGFVTSSVVLSPSYENNQDLPNINITNFSQSMGVGAQLGIKASSGAARVNFFMGRATLQESASCGVKAGVVLQPNSSYEGFMITTSTSSLGQLTQVRNQAGMEFGGNIDGFLLQSGYDGAKFQVGKANASHIRYSGDDDFLFMKSERFFLGGSSFISGSNGNLVLSSSRFIAGESGDVTIGDIGNEHTIINTSGMTVKDGDTSLAIFSEDVTLGEVASNKRNVFIDADVGVKIRNNTTDIASFGSDVTLTGGTITIGDSVDKLVVDDTGVTLTENSQVRAIFGATSVIGSAGAAVTTTSTDDCIRIGNGVVSIFESANSFVEVDANALKIVKGGHVSASFGTTTTIGPTSGSHIELTGAGLKLKKALTDDSVITTLDVSEDGVNIGKSAVAPSSANTPSAVVGNISLHGQGVRIYGAATNDYVDVKSDGVDVVAAGTTQAAFGATTTIGTSNDKVTLNADGVTLTEGGVDTIAMAGGAVTVGTVGNSKSRVQVTSDAVKIINRDSGGSDSTMIEFNSGGTITADEYIIEKTRLFGFGADGTVSLQSNGNFGVSDGGNGSGTKVGNNFTDSNGTAEAFQGGASLSGTFIMNQDLYFFDLTVGSGCTLKTNGNRLFVFGTLTNNGTIDNSGGNGGHGGNGGTNAQGARGTAGEQAGGGTLSSGSAGQAGGLAFGSSGGAQSGGGGGGSGASGGFVFISARTLAGSGTVRANGGDGGDGGNGGNGGSVSNANSGGGGSPPGAAGGGASSNATTRIDVVDPHIVTMMRDVMSNTETAPRLQVSGGSGGGGSGGGGAGSSATKNGQGGGSGDAASNCVVTADGVAGGNGGAGSTDNMGPGGGGGGGGGGNGGVVVIITTTATNPYTTQANGGAEGSGGTAGTNGGTGNTGVENGSDGTEGNAGKVIYIPV